LNPVRTIDVAHPPRPPHQVELALIEAWSAVRNSPTERVLKIVHGYGSSGKGGSTRETVRNWLFGNRKRFISIIHGEDATASNAGVEDLVKSLGQSPLDPDLCTPNPGVTVVWVK